jgi:hypothetical protein
MHEGVTNHYTTGNCTATAGTFGAACPSGGVRTDCIASASGTGSAMFTKWATSDPHDCTCDYTYTVCGDVFIAVGVDYQPCQ